MLSKEVSEGVDPFNLTSPPSTVKSIGLPAMKESPAVSNLTSTT